MGNKENCGHCEKHCEKWKNGAEKCHGRVLENTMAECTKEIVKGSWIKVGTTFGTFNIHADNIPRLVHDHCQAVEEELIDAEHITGPVRCCLIDHLPITDVEALRSAQYAYGYGARLHAPKYQAHTTWKVFDTEEEAEKHLEELLARDIF